MNEELMEISFGLIANAGEANPLASPAFAIRPNDISINSSFILISPILYYN